MSKNKFKTHIKIYNYTHNRKTGSSLDGGGSSSKDNNIIQTHHNKDDNDINVQPTTADETFSHSVMTSNEVDDSSSLMTIKKHSPTRYMNVTESIFYATLNHTKLRMVKIFNQTIIQKCKFSSKTEMYKCSPHYNTQSNSSKCIFFSNNLTLYIVPFAPFFTSLVR